MYFGWTWSACCAYSCRTQIADLPSGFNMNSRKKLHQFWENAQCLEIIRLPLRDWPPLHFQPCLRDILCSRSAIACPARLSARLTKLGSFCKVVSQVFFGHFLMSKAQTISNINCKFDTCLYRQKKKYKMTDSIVTIQAVKNQTKPNLCVWNLAFLCQQAMDTWSI